MAMLVQEIDDNKLDCLLDKNHTDERAFLFLSIVSTEIGNTFSEEQWLDACCKIDSCLMFEKARRKGLIEVRNKNDWLSPFDIKMLVDIPNKYANKPIEYVFSLVRA